MPHLIKSPILLKLALTKVLPLPRCNCKDFQEVTFKVLIVLFLILLFVVIIVLLQQ